MAKWYGKIGFGISVENQPGVWVKEIVEKEYTGDLLDDQRLTQPIANSVNDNINIQNRISILSDAFIDMNCSNMLYVTFMGAKWKIKDVKVNRPRLTISVGGVYNGRQT